MCSPTGCCMRAAPSKRCSSARKRSGRCSASSFPMPRSKHGHGSRSLSFAGAAKLTKLPPRSAIVAFSAGEVYAIAEMIRRRRGGCAVVMGRLSPRTRNAQVALYQDGEVDFLVATDAIGMGLNMDVNHVAFAGLQKFDGHRPRRLTAPEVAQIAGRAGRGMRDGTFGTTATCPDLPEDMVEAVEAHSFDPLDSLAWRNNSARFLQSVDALLDSLTAPPPRPGPGARQRRQRPGNARRPGARSGDARAGRPAAAACACCGKPARCRISAKSPTTAMSRLCARIFGHLGARPETAGGLAGSAVRQRSAAPKAISTR